MGRRSQAGRTREEAIRPEGGRAQLLKALEAENLELRETLAELALQTQALREALNEPMPFIQELSRRRKRWA
jgi:hypothetical protein